MSVLEHPDEIGSRALGVVCITMGSDVGELSQAFGVTIALRLVSSEPATDLLRIKTDQPTN